QRGSRAGGRGKPPGPAPSGHVDRWLGAAAPCYARAMSVVVAALFFLAAATPSGPDSSARAEPGAVYRSGDALRYYVFGRLDAERGDTQAALGEVYRALLLDTNAPSLARQASELSGRAGDADRALEFSERALKIDPGDARARWL